MAGEWIKVESSTPQKPEVVKMARILKKQRSQVFGALVMVWCWFDRNSVDGHVDGMVSTDIDEIAGLTGFAGAMIEVGWLWCDAAQQTLKLPNFERHNGESAKKRSLKNERQARWRSTGASTEPSTPPSTNASTREENKRVPIQHPPSPLKGAGQWWLTEEATKAKAAALGLTAWRGESWADFRQRIRDAIAKAKEHTHARGNGSAPPPALDPDQGHLIKPKGKFDDDPEEDQQHAIT